MGLSWRQKTGNRPFCCVDKFAASASKNKNSSYYDKLVASDVAPSIISTTTNENQDPYLSLNGIVCRYIVPSSIIDTSVTSNGFETEENPSTPQPPPPPH